MPYTEIFKIIEGGLSRDIKKVYNYAKLLAEKLNNDGDFRMANTIQKIIEKNSISNTTLDELSLAPVDQESRLNIVDIFRPGTFQSTIVISEYLDKRIEEFINTIKYQGEFKKMGVDNPPTLLLYGPPGYGKTTLAMYIAEKTNLPIVIARLDAVVSSLLGNTAKNIRKIFEFADSKPCILFLDEFDAIAKARDDQYELGELKRVINSLLQNIDHYASSNILIAATNHQELLDKAIWRRFNMVLKIDKMQEAELERLLLVFLKDVPNDFLTDKKKVDRLLKLMIDKSPSDIKNIIHNSIAKHIIQQTDSVKFEDVLIEFYEFDHHDISAVDDLIIFLNAHGISQYAIAQKLNVSLRTIRNSLKE